MANGDTGWLTATKTNTMSKFKNTYVDKKTFAREFNKLHGNVYLLDKAMNRQKRCAGLNVCWNTQTGSVLLTDYAKFVYEPENDTLTAEELKLKTKWQTSGTEAWKLGQRYFKCPNLKEAEWAVKSIPMRAYGTGEDHFDCGEAAYLYGNPKYEGKWNKAYGYDRNSAFSAGMLQEMPDTSVEPHEGKIKKGEIGFDILDGKLKMLDTGEEARWIFPAMQSPFRKFIYNYYEKKKNARNKWERAHYKSILNYYVGYLQIYNPFLRSAIIGYSNNFILNCMDADTIACNTDSIVSLRKRDDLTIGLGLGEFKEEHIGEFAFKGKTASINQWRNDECGNNKSCTPGLTKMKKGDDYNIFDNNLQVKKCAKFNKAEGSVRFEFMEE